MNEPTLRPAAAPVTIEPAGFGPVNFASDNVTGVAPEIMEAIVEANQPQGAWPYGNDEATGSLNAQFSSLFDTEASVYPVATGTAANALCLSLVAQPFNTIYCLKHSHTYEDEGGAPEFYTNGAKLVPVPAADGKMTAAALEAAIGEVGGGGARLPHVMEAAAVSIAQVSECGTVYTVDEIGDICAVARANGLFMHLDGARFANAVAALGCEPSDLTWRAGIDLMSFGATKNGAMAAEAVVLFNEDLEETLSRRRMRGGHLFSKMRFVSAQLARYVEGGLWLQLAANANAMAERLSAGLSDIDEVAIEYPVDANLIFATVPGDTAERLREAGFDFYDWGDPDRPSIRLVCAFNTDADDVDRFVEAARG
ncbi:MAG: beta-eliminating lyase-related protein [Rhodospirillaceae bacterium]|nr:beta-eliminating lyase-related protein [Rhodospirillaceae bacterium]